MVEVSCSDAMAQFEGARKKALENPDPKVSGAAQAYGALGETGVVVSIVAVVDSRYPDVVGQVTAQPGSGEGMRFADGKMVEATQVLISAGLHGSDLGAVLVHEGVHVADRAAFIGSIDVSADRWNPTLNITARQSEVNAYGVENHYRLRLGLPSVNIGATLSRPPYSVDPNFNRPLFPSLVR